jgi:hypothetical protein
MFNAQSQAKIRTNGFFLMTGFAFLPYLARDNIVVSLLLLGIVCLLPGLALIKVLKLKIDSITLSLFFGLLLSLFLLMSIFTLFSVASHMCGLNKPLSDVNVYVLLLVIVVTSGAYLQVEIVKQVRFFWSNFSGYKFLITLVSILLPTLSLFCVSRLNNQDRSKPTTCLLIVLVLSLLLLTTSSRFLKIDLSNNLTSVLLYSISAAILLGVTFRGNGGFWGYDINSEFFSASKVDNLHLWVPPQGNNAYDSMLSITVLPVVLSLFTKLNLVFLFKIFYPLALAAFPPVMFIFGIRYFSRLSVLIVVNATLLGSLSYIPQLPTLCRQIISSSFLLGLLLVPHQNSWTRGKKLGMITILSLGVAVSHYSTGYLISAIFMTASFLVVAIFLMSPYKYASRRGVFTLSTAMAIALSTFLWNGVITHSVENLRPIASTVSKEGLRILPNSEKNLFLRWISGTVNSQKYRASDLRKLDFSANEKGGVVAQPESFNYVVVPTSFRGNQVFGNRIAIAYSNIYFLARTFFLIVAGLGTLLFSWYFFSARRVKRNVPALFLDNKKVFDIFPVAFAALILGLFSRVSGTLAPYYNPERVSVTVAFFLFIPSCAFIELLLFRSGYARLFLVAPSIFFMIVLLLTASSLGGYITGFDTSRISVRTSDENPYLISANERSTASWVSKKLPPTGYLQSDGRGFLALLQVGRNPNFPSLDPFSLVPNSYIYASNANVVGHVANSYISYKFPSDYIARHYDLIYSSPRAQVYH